jgi:hypothetical protein
MRKIKPLARTLLIVCEGASTEPKYFEALAAISLDKEIYSNIEVYPAPKEEESAEEREQVRNKKRPTRQISGGTQKVPERIVEEADQDELAFINTKKGVETWPLPVRYIKEARDRVKAEGYNEAWTVFDMDGHARPDKAYELAGIKVKNIKINIAFSAISFEHWILMHFEKNNYPFNKSQCKDPKTEDSKECGTGAHQDDCQGKSCVSGHMILSKHLQSYDKGNSGKLFDKLLPLTNHAIENAAWLRAMQAPQLEKDPLWEVNPYTDVDFLVKRLLGIDDNHFAVVPGMVLTLDKLLFAVLIKDNKPYLQIENQTGAKVITRQFKLKLGEETIPQPENKIIEDKEILNWTIPGEPVGKILHLQFSNHIVSIQLPSINK